MGGLLILSIFSWRHTYCFGKCFAEIGRIAKTQQLGNLYDSQLWPVIQQILCPLDFQLHFILGSRNTDLLFKGGAKARLAHHAHMGQCRDGGVLADVRPYSAMQEICCAAVAMRPDA